MNKPDGKLSQESIELIIKEKTDLIIPKEFTVMENLIEHTEGAFDSDYSITLTIEYKEIEENYIINQILKSLDNNTDKGIWKKNNSGFDFIHSDNEDNRAEPFYFEIDTLINKIELNLTHL